MSGLSMVLNTAKHALSAQQESLNVTGHNIANVNTPGYSRQSALHQATDPMMVDGLVFGTGVDVAEITRSSDAMLEERLASQKSRLSGYEETQSYMALMETLFNENSETGLSSQISAFWNTWHDLSNMPTGSSERQAVYDTGLHLAEEFEWLSESMLQLDINLGREVQAAVSTVNILAEQIAALNIDISGASVTGSPNDLLDKRNDLVTQLANLIDIESFEQPNGHLTVATGSGHLLVYGADTFKLEMRTGQVTWVDSQSGGVDITDKIGGGKIGGWLEMRDGVLPKYRRELDVMAGEFIWRVNEQHSKGVGLDLFASALTGTDQTDDSHMFDTLAFADKIDYTGDFKMWISDASPAPPVSVTVDMSISTAGPNYAAVGSTFATADTTYQITATGSGTVGTDAVTFSWERSGGFTGSGAMAAGDNFLDLDDGSRLYMGAGTIQTGNTLRINTDGAAAPDPLIMTPTAGTMANSALDTYIFTAQTGGAIGTDLVEIQWQNSTSFGTFTLDPAEPMSIEVDGMTLDFTSGTLRAGDVFTVQSDANKAPSVNLPSQWHWTLDSFAGEFNRQADAVAGGGAGSGYLQASVADNALAFTPAAGYRFGFSDDQTQDSGLAAALGFNTFFTGKNAGDIGVNKALEQKGYIAAARINATTGDYGSGDNSNSVFIADLQYATLQMAQWTVNRKNDDSSQMIGTSLEGYYQGMIGSIGIKAASISRNVEFNEVLVEQIQMQRDSISGVNLDEEMINLMKFQHAFAVASKLISVADEMMATLIEAK